MKLLILFVSIILLMSCSTTQNFKHESNKNVIPKENSNFGKTQRFGSIEIAPYPIKKVPPTYPSSARNAGIEGEVWLQVEIFADGSVGAIEVIKSLMPGSGGLDEAAVKAVRKWIFKPAMSAERPAACWTTIPVKFKLK